MSKLDNQFENLNPEDFVLVQADEKLYDKKFETKPIGYFKDAMIRFGRNRTNVIATSILFIIILCSIIIPVVSTKNVDTVKGEYSYLPPRMPILEKIGIFDGTSTMVDQPVKLDTIGFMEDDPETDIDESLLGLPYDERDKNDPEYDTAVLAEYIVEGTLENYTLACAEADILCEGGENTLRVRNPYTHVAIASPQVQQRAWDEDPYIFYLDKTANPFLSVSVTEFFTEENEASLEVYGRMFYEAVVLDDEDNPVLDDEGNAVTEIVVLGEYVLLGTITETGEFTDMFNVLDVVPAEYAENEFGFQVKLSFVTTNTKDYIAIESVNYGDETSVDDPETEDVNEASIEEFSGYWLSEWAYDNSTGGDGYFARQNGTILYSSYTYRNYDAAFSDSIDPAYPQSKYDAAMEEFADICVIVNEIPALEIGDYGVGTLYNDECPIKEVIGTTSVVIDPYGNANFSYILRLNKSQLAGQTEMPFFLFGTDDQGRDMFTLLWLATRTSLMLGVIVSVINISVGVVYGSVSGYYGGMTDLIMQRIAEVIGRIPLLVTLSIMIALFDPGIETLIFILIVNGWIGIASITRTQFYRYKGREYVLASRTLGAKDGRLIFRHILPNGIGTIITQSVLSIPGVIFLESTLSYLGFGLGNGQSFTLFGLTFSGASIGVLLAEARPELLNRPYLTLFPAILISILMITFNMFGNALRDAFNPALRGSE